MRQDARVKYPWAQWMRGEVNEHTADKPVAFRNYLYEYAKRHEMYVSASINGQVVRFQFFDTIDDYVTGRQPPKQAARDSHGHFVGRDDTPALNRLCAVCGARLTPAAPEDAEECYRFDFEANAAVRVHAEAS